MARRRRARQLFHTLKNAHNGSTMKIPSESVLARGGSRGQFVYSACTTHKYSPHLFLSSVQISGTARRGDRVADLACLASTVVVTTEDHAARRTARMENEVYATCAANRTGSLREACRERIMDYLLTRRLVVGIWLVGSKLPSTAAMNASHLQKY